MNRLNSQLVKISLLFIQIQINKIDWHAGQRKAIMRLHFCKESGSKIFFCACSLNVQVHLLIGSVSSVM